MTILSEDNLTFDPNCTRCPRLVAWREQVARVKRRAFMTVDYWGKPVPAFGDFNGRLLVAGFAPGAHGSNRTGRMFTGDASGNFLFPALYRMGFANQPLSTDRKDDLILTDMLITSICRCVPPSNKPTRQELETCRGYAAAEINRMPNLQGIVALGRIAFEQILEIFHLAGYPTARLIFRHGAIYPLGDELPWLLGSYHPSRQNTQTGRLTREMFDQVWLTAISNLRGNQVDLAA